MDRRYYLMIGIIAAVFCAGSLFLGGRDAKNAVHQMAMHQKVQQTALDKQLAAESAPASDSDVVTAGY